MNPSRPSPVWSRFERVSFVLVAATVLTCLVGATIAVRRFKAQPIVRQSNPIPQYPPPMPPPKKLQPELIS